MPGKLPFHSPPDTLCLLRLSAIGDISHTIPVVRTIQHAWPNTRITWIIGKTEYGLVHDMEGIEFIVFDKSKGYNGYRDIHKQLKGRYFDVLLHMQMSIRSSLISLMINSPVKLGFDKPRAKDYQWLFTNHRIEPRTRQHVIDSFFGFTEALGIEDRVLEWNIPIPDEAKQFAEQTVDNNKKVLVISPCSSMAYRNWSCEGYAEIADYAVQQGMQVILTGGPSAIEKQYADCIKEQLSVEVTDLIGKTSIKQLLAILARANVVVSPDSGPAHLATAVGTPVIGLYACTNPNRARPYLSEQWLVNRYPQALKNSFNLGVDEAPWGKRVKDKDAMKLITATDIIDKINIINQG